MYLQDNIGIQIHSCLKDCQNNATCDDTYSTRTEVLFIYCIGLITQHDKSNEGPQGSYHCSLIAQNDRPMT
jgi:hypothetical protein